MTPVGATFAAMPQHQNKPDPDRTVAIPIPMTVVQGLRPEAARRDLPIGP